MKNTHCCQCGQPRGVAPQSHGWRSDAIASGIYRPCQEPDRNPAPGVNLEQSPSMCIQASVWRNGGDSGDVHICPVCTTKAVRHLRNILSATLGE